jgi:DNA-binding transcriptional LysR family regulator
MDATIPLDDISMFVRVMEAKSFSAAARDLRLPTSTLSRAVARLEDRLGAQLLVRTTRTLAPTAEGSALFEAAVEPVRALRDLGRAAPFGRDAPQGTLRITAPNDLGDSLVADVVTRFTARYPSVRVEVELTARTVDLVAEGSDLALRAGSLRDSSLVARRVGDLPGKLYASPIYVTRRGMPESPADLAAHDCVLFRSRSGKATWRIDDGGGLTSVEVTGRIAGDDFMFLRSAMRAGAGIGILPHLLAQGDLTRGLLVPVLPRFRTRSGALHVVYPQARHVPAKVTAFRDFVVERYRALAGEA